MANNTAGQMSRLSLYTKIQELLRVFEEKQAKVEQMMQAKSELAQVDLDAMRTLQKCEARLNHHK